MEVYEDSNNILSYPPVSDYSFEMRQLIHYFSRAYRNHCTNCVNRYLFSYGNDFACITPIRSRYRVIGRIDNFKYVKRSKYFDTFFVGSFEECVHFFRNLISSYVFVL